MVFTQAVRVRLPVWKYNFPVYTLCRCFSFFWPEQSDICYQSFHAKTQFFIFSRVAFFLSFFLFFLRSPGKKFKLIVVQFSQKKHSIIFKYLVSWKPLIGPHSWVVTPDQEPDNTMHALPTRQNITYKTLQMSKEKLIFESFWES